MSDLIDVSMKPRDFGSRVVSQLLLLLLHTLFFASSETEENINNQNTHVLSGGLLFFLLSNADFGRWILVGTCSSNNNNNVFSRNNFIWKIWQLNAYTQLIKSIVAQQWKSACTADVSAFVFGLLKFSLTDTD